MATPYLSIRPGHPDFLDLDWTRPIVEWESDRIVELPTGVHRHEIVFVAYLNDIYAIKELPVRLARHEYEMLRILEQRGTPTVTPVGVVERRWLDPYQEPSGAVITRYVEFAFPYRELITGGGFGPRRDQMLDAFAGLLCELHLAGCFWGDCSLSNVLYRYDADAIQAVMIDAETVEIHDALTPGQRAEDLEIMRVNVAGGMADVAAEQGLDIDEADLFLGDDVIARYEGLWSELTTDVDLGPEERYRISGRIDRLQGLGFVVEDVELVPLSSGGDRLRMKVAVGGRTFHSNRLRELTRIEATEHQAQRILSDLQYHEARFGGDSRSGKAVAAIQWRVGVFEPLLARIAELLPDGADPVQGYCDFLHHRYLLAASQGRDVDNDEALDSWFAGGMPGTEPH